MPAALFELSEVRDAERHAEETGGLVFSWKTRGPASWLKRGVHHCNVLYLVVLPRTLHDFIEMPIYEDLDESEKADLEEAISLAERQRTDSKRVLFSPGNCVITPGAQSLLEEEQLTSASILDRHVVGDWGEISPEDCEENELSLREGQRLMSVYSLPKTGEKIWVMTEWDRSITTLLLPSEY